MLGRRKEGSEAGAAKSAAAPAPRKTPTTVRTAPAPAVHKRLGDFLVEAGLISEDQLTEAVERQKQEGGFLGQILVRLGYVTQEAVASCLVKQCKIPHLSLMDYDIDSDVLNLVPREICKKYNLLPIDKLGRILTVAMVDPLDLEALEAVRNACPELRIKPILCNWEHYDTVSAKIFGKQQKTEAGTDSGITAESLGLTAKQAPRQRAAQQQAPAEPERAQAETPPERPTPPPADSGAALEQRQPASPAGNGEVAAMLREANAEMAQTIREALRETVAGTAPQSAMPAGDEMAQMIRDSVGGALQEALAAVVVQLRAQAKPEPPATPPVHEFAEVIRDSVGGAMQESMATMLVQLRAMMGKQAGETARTEPDKGGLDTQAMGNALEGVQQQMTEAVREALAASQAAQQEQGARLSEVAEAVLQAVQQSSQLLEMGHVNGQTQSELRRPGKKHASVTPFGPPKQGGEDPARAEADAEVRDALESEKPLENLTLDTFLPGSANAFTYRLSEAVAAAPGGEYNPFFLYGNVGIGKTHLISGIGNAILANHPNARVGYVSASHFARRLADAMKENAQDAFREGYCHWDVLILDDIQFMGGRVEAQEEFFHIFNVLHQQARQIIIASDKAPDRLGLLENRLVSRFASGIVVELKAPEWETRMEILRQQVRRAEVEVPEEILSLVAMRVANDVRKMNGSLRKIVAFANLVGQEMSCEMADEILSHLGVGEAA